MKKLFTLFSLIFLILTANTFCVFAEELDGKDISLSLSFGSRSGIYTGTLENNLPDGYGKFESKTPDGIEWYHEGSFVDGHFQGEGTEVWADGKKEAGNYQNDLLNGHGKRFVNGQLVYEGEWKDGKYHGNGTEYAGGSQKWAGDFQDGILVDGSYFVNGIQRAQGTWKNGAIWNGRTYDEEGNPHSTFQDGQVKTEYAALFFMAIPFIIVIGFPIMVGILYKRHRKNQVKAQIALMNAQQEMKDQKTINWVCPSCGASNHNREKCEYCETGKPR